MAVSENEIVARFMVDHLNGLSGLASLDEIAFCQFADFLKSISYSLIAIRPLESIAIGRVARLFDEYARLPDPPVVLDSHDHLGTLPQAVSKYDTDLQVRWPIVVDLLRDMYPAIPASRAADWRRLIEAIDIHASATLIDPAVPAVAPKSAGLAVGLNQHEIKDARIEEADMAIVRSQEPKKSKRRSKSTPKFITGTIWDPDE